MVDTLSIKNIENKLSNYPSLLIPDLIGLQYGSFQQFLVIGIRQAFQTINPIICHSGKETFKVEFFPEKITFRKPELKPNQALFFGKTYGCSIYIPALISSTRWPEEKMEWILLGFLPIMTKNGDFIINGIPRVILHQMVRNPGIYILPNDARTKVPTIRIVPEQGSWINITIDKKNRLWLTTRLLRRKISILIFLQALGISFNDLKIRIKYSNLLSLSRIKSLKSNEKTRHGRILDRAHLENHPMSQSEAQRYIYAHVQEYTSLHKDQVINDQTAEEFFNTIIWNPNNRNLGFLGREQFIQKFPNSIGSNDTLLNSNDLVYATDALLKLICGEEQGADIDSLENKRIRGCGNFLKDQLIRGLREFENVFTRKFNLSLPHESETIWKLQKSSLAKFVSKSWKSFFTSGTLSQFLDETNPLSELTHKRRITVLGPGGVSSKQTTIQIRGIHPTYYGRLCPIETPEGQNAGLVNSLTVFARPNNIGYLETPFFKIYKGQVQKFLNPQYYTPYQEANYLVAPADLPVSETLKFSSGKLPVRKYGKFEYGYRVDITNQAIHHLQMISVATSLIPFLEHDDANRALMGSNMQRQAVPLIQPEGAYVQTGLENRVISDVQHSLHTHQSAYITEVSSQLIKAYKPDSLLSNSSTALISKLRSSIYQYQEAPINFYKIVQTSNTASLKNSYSNYKTRNRRIQNISKNKNFLYLDTELNTSNTTEYKGQLIITTLNQYHRTNQSTCKYHNPNVNEKEWVEKSDILADGAASIGGRIALGKNIFVAYLPWEGYNFEDAILISERLVREDIFTSLHIDYYELEVKNTQYGLETITNKVPIEAIDSDKDVLRIQILQSNGLIPVGTWVEEGDYLVGKITPMNPRGPSVQQQYEKLYNVIMQREHTNVRNTSLRVPKGVEGFVYAIDILPPKEPDVLSIAGKDSILRVRVALLQRRRIQVGDKMAGRHGNKGIVSKILPEYDMPFLPDGTPIDIILNPLGVPSRMNVGQILECLLGLASRYLEECYQINLFDEEIGAEASRSFVYSKLLEASIKTKNKWLFEPHHPGKIKLFDGRTGQIFDQAVTVGCTYMLKLVHLVDDKLHARATGPYSAITQQPVRGRSRNGGQRLGEMEVWALQAYGAASILQELLTIKSDDVDGRKEAVFQIYTSQPIQYGPPESFRVLIRELQALCFDLKLFKKTNRSTSLKAINFQFLESLGKNDN